MTDLQKLRSETRAILERALRELDQAEFDVCGPDDWVVGWPDFLFSLMDKNGRFVVNNSYKPQLFDGPTADRLCQTLQNGNDERPVKMHPADFLHRQKEILQELMLTLN